jgi:hypothetical protein
MPGPVGYVYVDCATCGKEAIAVVNEENPQRPVYCSSECWRAGLVTPVPRPTSVGTSIR